MTGTCKARKARGLVLSDGSKDLSTKACPQGADNRRKEPWSFRALAHEYYNLGHYDRSVNTRAMVGAGRHMILTLGDMKQKF